MLTLCGLDEAGRGALAGPLVMAAVTLKEDFKFNDGLIIRDSKTMTDLQKNKAYIEIQKNALSVRVHSVEVDSINQKGIGWANVYGFVELIKVVEADKYIIDGRFNLPHLDGKDNQVECMIDADSQFLPAICAGIVAKVVRDKIMTDLHNKFPDFEWYKNMGYGTKKHIEALKIHGLSIFHREQFVNTALKNKFRS